MLLNHTSRVVSGNRFIMHGQVVGRALLWHRLRRHLDTAVWIGHLSVVVECFNSPALASARPVNR